MQPSGEYRQQWRKIGHSGGKTHSNEDPEKPRWTVPPGVVDDGGGGPGLGPQPVGM